MNCTERGPSVQLSDIVMDPPLKKITSLSSDGLPAHLLQLSLNVEQDPTTQCGYSRLMAAPGIVGAVATGFPLMVSNIIHTSKLFSVACTHNHKIQ